MVFPHVAPSSNVQAVAKERVTTSTLLYILGKKNKTKKVDFAILLLHPNQLESKVNVNKTPMKLVLFNHLRVA